MANELQTQSDEAKNIGDEACNDTGFQAMIKFKKGDYWTADEQIPLGTQFIGAGACAGRRTAGASARGSGPGSTSTTGSCRVPPFRRPPMGRPAGQPRPWHGRWPAHATAGGLRAR